MKIRFLITIITIAAATFSVKSQINAEQVMNIGRNVLSMDDYMLSIHYFNLAAEAKPYLAEPYYYRALAKLMLDDYRGAEADASMALDRNKFMTEAYRVRGFARLQLNRDSLALLDFEQGLEYQPIDKYFLYYKVSGLSQLKQYDKARETIGTLLRYYPGFEHAYAARAQINYLSKDTTAALADIDSALMRNKNDVFPYQLRTEIAVNRKQWEPASKDLDTIIMLEPKETSNYLNRAFVRYNNDDYFGAMSDYNYILELEPENLSARYNRALLLYEVMEYKKAVDDFSEVLRLRPDNFHAIYARALINLDLGKWRDAIADLHKIVAKYPRFHQGYYALAHAYSRNGNTAKAIENYNKAENLVKQYVTNPTRHPLDKPTIEAGETNFYADKPQEGETDFEVMERFNKLVTVSNALESTTAKSYQEEIKGRVQDREMRVEPVAMFIITPFDSHTELRPASNYIRELGEYNTGKYAPWKLYLGTLTNTQSDREAIDKIFDMANFFTKTIENAGNKPRPIDYFNRGVALSVLKDFNAAIADFDSTINLTPDMTLAYLGRSAALTQRAYMVRMQHDESTDKVKSQMNVSAVRHDLQMAINDLDKALTLNPRLVYAWFNKGNIYYSLGDYTSALECYNRALELRSDFPEAYYNRGLTYLSLGNRESGRADLSRAGELGILPSYSVLKRI